MIPLLLYETWESVSINGLPIDPTLYPHLEKYSSFKEYSNNFIIPLLLYETLESVNILNI